MSQESKNFVVRAGEEIKAGDKVCLYSDGTIGKYLDKDLLGVATAPYSFSVDLSKGKVFK